MFACNILYIYFYVYLYTFLEHLLRAFTPTLEPPRWYFAIVQVKIGARRGEREQVQHVYKCIMYYIMSVCVYYVCNEYVSVMLWEWNVYVREMREQVRSE